MDIIDVSILLEKIKKILRCDDFSENEYDYVFSMQRGTVNTHVILSKKELSETLDLYYSVQKSKLGGLFSDNRYEIFVKNESHFPNSDSIQLEDSVNELKYSVGKPSLCYLIYLIMNIDNERKFQRFLISNRMRDSETMDFCTFFYNYIRLGRRVRTIVIESEKKLSENKFEGILNSLVFHLGFNLGVVYVLPNSFEDIYSYSTSHYEERNSIEDLEPPKRIYINEIISFYQQGLAADSVFLEYLSFYHVLEFFFDQVLYKHLENRVITMLTDPGFSYKNGKKIQGLIKLITDTVKAQHEEFSFDEKSSLQLVLEKYIKISELKDEIYKYNDRLIEYYKDNAVNFSKGSKVDLNLIDFPQVYRNLADRIYKTRCSLVHTKGFSEQKFIPFKDDKELINEVILIKIIAEQIIINSSEIIK